MDLLSLLTPQERASARHIVFRKGQTLFQEGDQCPGVFFLARGKVKIASVTLQGREVVYNVLREGQVFGNNLAFAANREFRGAVMALSEGTLEWFPAAELVKIMQGNAAFLTAYLSAQSEFGKALNFQLKLLGFDKAEERFRYYLSAHQGKISFRTVSSLAEELFLSREALSRLLHRLQEEGEITWEKKNIMLRERF